MKKAGPTVINMDLTHKRKPFRSKIDPSFPRAIKQRKKSIFGFLNRFGGSKKTQIKKDDPGEQKKKERVNVPLEEIKHQEEKIEVEVPHQKNKQTRPEVSQRKTGEEDLSELAMPKIAASKKAEATEKKYGHGLR